MSRARAPHLGHRLRSRTLSIARSLAPLALLLCACGDAESDLEEARALQEAGQFADSIPVLRGVLEDAPERAEANYRLGLALVQTGEALRGTWPLQTAITDPEYTVRAGVLLATLYHQTRNFDESVRAADAVLEAEPDNADALRVRANAHLAARRIDTALADAEQLVALRPDDYTAHALLASTLADIGQLEEARVAYDRVKVLGANADDPLVVERSCIAPAVFAADSLDDPERARVLFEACAALSPSDPGVLDTLARFFDTREESERGTEIISNSAAARPDDLGIQLLHVQRLHTHGDPEASLARLEEISTHFDSAAAWSALAAVYRQRDRPEDALRAIEKTVERSPVVDPQLLFTQADLLIDIGELERARELAAALDHETYAHLIRGRVLLISGDPAAALAAFEQGIRAWPNNPGARFLAGLAARDLGDVDRALEELREAVRAGRGETDAALEMARIHFERDEVEKALAFANTALAGPRGRHQAGPYVITARALAAMGEDERALRAIDVLAERGFALEATRERAFLERQRGAPAGALESIEASGLDPADPLHYELLGQLAEALLELDRGAEALAKVDAALARSADRGPLHQIRGVVLLHGGRGEEAEQAFRRAIELDGESGISLAGLATVRHGRGDAEGAIALFDRADAADPGAGAHAYTAAQIQLGLDRADAERRLRALVARNSGHAGAANDLAWVLATERRDLDFALELVEGALMRTRTPEVLDTAGWVRIQRGEFPQAVTALSEAVDARGDSPSMRYRQALALEGAGEPDRARKALEHALSQGPFPEEAEARIALERLQPPAH